VRKLVQVVRKSDILRADGSVRRDDVEREITKSEVDLIVRKIGSTSISVGVEDLLRLWEALDPAARYLSKRDHMNATLHLESVRRSPLTTRLVNARDRLEKILADSIPLRTGHPAPTPTPPQPEKSPEIKVHEKSSETQEEKQGDMTP